jgi:mono/diheme cytochrome c family protein
MSRLRPLPDALASLLLLAFLGACATSDGEDPDDPEDQVERGGRVFSAVCAECHGASGQGTKDAPPLVGPGALPRDPRPTQERDASFFTAFDVANFVIHNMPPFPDERERIPPADHWAVVAFALDANGVKLDEPLGPSNADKIMLHK